MAHVWFVVMKDPEHELLLTIQMIGQAGRDGEELHTIVIDTQWANLHKLGPHNQQLRFYPPPPPLMGAEADDTGRNPLTCMWQVARIPEDLFHAVILRQKPMTLAGIPSHACGKLPGFQREGFAASVSEDERPPWTPFGMRQGVQQGEHDAGRPPPHHRRGVEGNCLLTECVTARRNVCLTSCRSTVHQAAETGAHQATKQKGVLMPEHFLAPWSDSESIGQRYYGFRKRFNFKAYTYCFTCRMPQEQNYRVARGIGNAKAVIRRLPSMAALQAEVEGWYHNAIEVFLWCWKQASKRQVTGSNSCELGQDTATLQGTGYYQAEDSGASVEEAGRSMPKKQGEGPPATNNTVTADGALVSGMELFSPAASIPAKIIILALQLPLQVCTVEHLNVDDKKGLGDLHPLAAAVATVFVLFRCQCLLDFLTSPKLTFKSPLFLLLGYSQLGPALPKHLGKGAVQPESVLFPVVFLHPGQYPPACPASHVNVLADDRHSGQEGGQPSKSDYKVEIITGHMQKGPICSTHSSRSFLTSLNESPTSIVSAQGLTFSGHVVYCISKSSIRNFSMYLSSNIANTIGQNLYVMDHMHHDKTLMSLEASMELPVFTMNITHKSSGTIYKSLSFKNSMFKVVGYMVFLMH
ncbi:hypothetical protein HD554DRAFT_2039911 [Boletus coccyginus]|nr:hypothetical protein HD554DRAFT_2039911 [Boletus coccyginus]